MSEKTDEPKIFLHKQSFVKCPKCGHKEVSYGHNHSVCPRCYEAWIRLNVPTMDEL